VVLPHGNDLVDNLNGGIALTLALPDLLRVTAALGNWTEIGSTWRTQRLTAHRAARLAQLVSSTKPGQHIKVLIQPRATEDAAGVRTEIVDIKHLD